MRLSRAARAVFPHQDVDGLEGVLRDARAKGGPADRTSTILVITDGVFRMDGDIAPLPGICDVAERYGAAVMVDDAHASGVLGRNGRGTVDHFGLHGRVDIQVGTLSKAVGVLGGYVAGRQHLRDYLIQRSRPFLFSHVPPAGRGRRVPGRHRRPGGRAGADRAAVGEHALLQGGAAAGSGFDTGVSETPITPVIVGDSEKAGRLSGRLFELGVFAQAVVYPTVATGPGAHPHDRDQRAHARRPPGVPGRVRDGGPGAAGDLSGGRGAARRRGGGEPGRGRKPRARRPVSRAATTSS